MIDHLDLPVSDYHRSRRFYAAALAPLGYQPGWEPAPGAGCFTVQIPGAPAGSRSPVFWLHQDGESAVAGLHLAFSAGSASAVRAFYDAALSTGGVDNGAPGERPQYHPGYFAAYVLDPDGVNVEAVCHSA